MAAKTYLPAIRPTAGPSQRLPASRIVTIVFGKRPGCSTGNRAGPDTADYPGEANMTSVVDHLKKVVLTLRWDNHSTPFEFILGAASEGLCPFECELLNKSAGDRFTLSIPWAMSGQTFAHLQGDVCRALAPGPADEALDLDITVVAVKDPEPREVVRALAQAAEQHGCGGDCGCGCGGH